MRNERSRIHGLKGVARRLDGISYKVLEDSETIREYVNAEVMDSATTASSLKKAS